MNKIVVLGLVVFLLAGFCLVQGQEVETSPGTTPDNVFYGLDRAMESIQLAMTRNDLKRADLHLKFAEERLAELDAMVKKNKTQYSDRLAKDESEEIAKAQESLDKAAAKGEKTAEVAARVAEMTAKHILVLQRVLGQVPESGRQGILNAINVSTHGNEQAVLSILKEKPENKTKPPYAVPPGDLPPILEQGAEDEGAQGNGQGAGSNGKLVMKITDKPSTLNITKLEITLSSVKVHVSGTATEGKECVEESYVELVCENETETDENCTEFNVTNEVCVNETKVNQTCTAAECVNGTFADTECVNGTLIPEACINNSYVELVCNNETETDENCTEFNVTNEVCNNETKSRTVCNQTAETTAGWKTILDQSKTFDLIAIKGVKQFLGENELPAGKYTQIRVYVTEAKATINGVTQTLKIPSGTLKLIKPFTISSGQNTTLTLDFDAEASVHAAGDQYIMRPTVKVIQE